MCSVEGCNNKVLARGLCSRHYQEKLKSGDLQVVKKIERHGLRYSPEYQSWKAMKKRCYNRNHPHFKRYGGRGITVCERWENSFSAFYEDMGKRPFFKAQLDRIDNDGNYEPGNCRWVSAAENSRNRSRTKLSEQTVKQIRSLYSTGEWTQSGLAKKFNVANISPIVRGKIWVQ